jgi:shikimate kinase
MQKRLSRDIPIALIGLPGAGKTSVGRALAARLGRPFVDLDEAVSQRLGAAPAEAFARLGEAAFRDAEEAALAEALAPRDGEPDPVVATGGGAVLREANRRALAKSAFVVWLELTPEAAAARLTASPEGFRSRPILAGDGAARMRELWEVRRVLYEAAADARVDASADSPDRIAAAAEAAYASRR